jgi:hexosaminidase
VATFSDLPLLPRPREARRAEGKFLLTEKTALQFPDELQNEAGYLRRILRRGTGFSLPARSGPSDGNTIRLSLDGGLSNLGREGYRLVVESGTIDVRAAAPAGVFYGIQTLLQLLPPAIFGAGPRPEIEWTVPQGTIEDWPHFGWRGAMLDCSRHFRTVDFIRKFIDLLALHKLNTFHWHLTDDQGWRVEIRKYPRLTETGAWRRGTWIGHGSAVSTDDGRRHGGFYTQDQIREVVRHAAERHITIVPEIEMPGHAQAALAAYPEFGCTTEPLEPWTRWGVSENIFHPGEKTISFLQDVLREVMELFPGPFIHLGGDEAVKKQWEESGEIRALMAQVDAKTANELQSYFMRRMEQFLAGHGRRLIGWDEILEGGLPPGAAVMSWRGMEGGMAAANSRHDVVMAPDSHTYFDHYQSANPESEPLSICGCLPLEKVHGFHPVPPQLSPEAAGHILGVQGQLWAEYMPTEERVEFAAFPRLSALAEVAWLHESGRDYPSFLARLKGHLRRLDVLGVRYRPLDSLASSATAS